MNKKGQSQMGVGGFVLLFIAVLVGLILLQGSAQNLNGVLNTVSVVNESFGSGVASNSTTVYYTNYKALNNVVIINRSNGVVVPSTNYTVTNNIVYNGALASSIVPTSAAVYGFTGYNWNVTYTGEPVTYGSASDRSVTNMIIIFFALALAAIAIGYAVKGYNQ